MQFASTLIILLLCYSCASGQGEERIDTDRPDQTESAFTVPHKYFQWEAGIVIERIKKDNISYSLPTSLFKYGLSKRVELRLESTFNRAVTRVLAEDKKLAGLEPVEIGTKVALMEEKKWMPKTSVIVHLGFPSLASKDYKI